MPLGPILSDVLDVLVMLVAPSFASGKNMENLLWANGIPDDPGAADLPGCQAA